MKFSDRIQFTFDPQLGTIGDTVTALGLADEYVTRFAPNPPPRFFEVDRPKGGENLDELWGTNKTRRLQFTDRVLNIPALNQFSSQSFRPWWNRVTTRGDRFWISYLGLQRADYFPIVGDQVYWNGYRLTIINVNVPPESYWGQTGIWTALTTDCVLAPYGDALLPPDLSRPAPNELAGNVNLPAPRVGENQGFVGFP